MGLKTWLRCGTTEQVSSFLFHLSCLILVIGCISLSMGWLPGPFLPQSHQRSLPPWGGPLLSEDLDCGAQAPMTWASPSVVRLSGPAGCMSTLPCHM